MNPLVQRARDFAQAAHAGQTRKGPANEAYFTHLEEVALLVEGFGGDAETLAAAWLHDTVEDCDGITEVEITLAFGRDVAGLVMELTDDKSLPKAERKRLQVVHAAKKSDRAALIKVADKISNIRSVALRAPVDWDDARRGAYVDWACEVVGSLPFLPDAAQQAFTQAVEIARSRIGR